MSIKRVTVAKYPFLVLYTDSGIYYLRTSINGRLVEKSTGEKSLSKALVIAKRLMSIHGGDVSKIGRVNYEDLREEVLLAKSNMSKATHDSAKFQFAKLDRFFEGMAAEKLTENQWERYSVFSKSEEPNRQLEHDRRHYLMVCSLAYKRGLLKQVVRIKKIQSKGQVGRALSDDEVSRLLQMAKKCSDEIYLQSLMALTMGMRKSEVLKLTWDRVDLKKRLIHLRAQDTKIRKARTFGISDQVLPHLEARQQKGAFVFPHRQMPNKPQMSNKTIWTEVRKLSGVKCRFHDLRHTFLTKAFKQVMNPALICHYAGLSLEEAQKTYLHITPEDTRAVSNIPWENMGNEK